MILTDLPPYFQMGIWKFFTVAAKFMNKITIILIPSTAEGAE